MRWLTYALLAILLVAAGFVLGYRWPHNSRDVSSAQGCFVVDAKYQPARHSGLTECDVSRCIVGTVQNRCAQRFDTIFVNYNLYDNSGIQVGTANGLIQSLDPNGAAHFWALVSEDVPKGFKFKLINISVVRNK